MSAEKVINTNDESVAPIGVVLTLLIGLLVPLVAGVLACGKLARSQRYVVDLARFRPMPSEDLAAAETIGAVLQREIFDDEQCSVFSPNLNLQVRQAYESSPWIRRVTEIERVFPNRLRIEVEWREPLAPVEYDGRFLLVDDRGQLLPAESDEPLVEAPIISMRRHGVEPISEKGLTDAWMLEAIDRGVSVINELLDSTDLEVFDAIGLTHIDMSNHGLRLDSKVSEVTLVTNAIYVDSENSGVTRPVVIHWGRDRNHKLGAIELSVARKLKNLRTVLAARPGLSGVRVVDVRFDPPHWR